MGSIVLRPDLDLRFAQGKNYSQPVRLTSSAATTAAAGPSGFNSVQVFLNTLGTTFFTTLIDIPFRPGVTAPMRLMTAMQSPGVARTLYLARLYKIGTVALTATGNQLTHDAATFPVLRSVFGQASTAVPLMPILFITTATTTTAAVIRLATAADGTGYTNQDGTAIRGIFNFTLPNAATTLSSGFVLVLENGDSAVRDISQVRVVTSAAAGAASVYGAELLAPLSTPLAGLSTTIDTVYGGVSMVDLTPAVATSGTASSLLVVLSFGSVAASTVLSGEISAVGDTP